MQSSVDTLERKTIVIYHNPAKVLTFSYLGYMLDELGSHVVGQDLNGNSVEHVIVPWSLYCRYMLKMKTLNKRSNVSY